MDSRYQIRPFYQGGYSSFSPSYGDVFTGYKSSVESLGISTNPNEATVAKNFSDRANLGIKEVEVEALLPKVFDAMPKQQFKEINRLSKLTGVDVSFHGPLVEPSGVTQQGYTEASREAAERQMLEAIKRVNEANPNNMIINFHSSNQFPAAEISRVKNMETGEMETKIEKVLVVDTDSGKVAGAIPIKKEYFPGEENQTSASIIKKYNESAWNGKVTNLGYSLIRAKEYLSHSGLQKEMIENIEKNGGNAEGIGNAREIKSQYNIGRTFLNDSYREFKDLFNRAYESCSPEERKKMDGFKKQITDDAKKITELEEDRVKSTENASQSIDLRNSIIERGIDLLKDFNPPETYKPLDDFMMDKTATTFGNVAYKSFKQFGEKAPIVVIENPPANQQFSRGEDLKNIVEKAREKFVEDAVKDGMSKGEAQSHAEKFLGATWDVGHINMLRQFGFEDKDIIKETEIVAKLVKHVHLSDNFGFEHTELPMGMGNVPLKQMMEKLGKEGFEGKKIIEAADWWTQHFPKGGGMPFTPSLEGMGSPMFETSGGPSWNQYLGLQQGYLGGQGTMLPQINYETFGGGFSQLPTELGGQRQGAGGSRMSGRPME